MAIESRAGDAIDLKPIFELWPLAHHAGCLLRINCPEGHCVSDVGTYSPIGQYSQCRPSGQDVGELLIWQRSELSRIGL